MSGVSVGNGLFSGKTGLSPISGFTSGGGLSFQGFGGGAPTPALDLNFASGTMPSGVTFSRASTATLVNSSGYVTYAPNNFATYSQDFSTNWTNTYVVTGTATAPDGTSTAQQISETNSVTYFQGYQTYTFNSNRVVYSIYVKQGTNRYALINASTNGGYADKYGITVDLQTGLVTQTDTLGSPTGCSNLISSVGNGWYRVSIAMDVYSSILAVGFCLSDTGTPTSFAPGSLAVIVNGNSANNIYLWGAQVEAVTYQTTPSTYKATTTTPYNGPRIDYNPATLVCKGLLIEQQNTNLEAYSNFVGWNTISTNVTPNAALSPSNTMDATLIVPASGYSGGYIFYSNSVSTITSLTYSVYAKAAGYSQIALRESSTGGDSAVFDLSTGTVAGVYNSGPITISNPQITPAGNGWYRISMTCTIVGGPNQSIGIVPLDGSWTSGPTYPFGYVGNGGSGFYVWGAQLEAGSILTSYIPTSGSSVIRAQDIADMTGTNFSSWYNQTEGTFVNTFDVFDSYASTTIIAGGGLPYWSFTNNDLASGIEFNYSSVRLATGSIVANASNKISGAYSDNDFASSLDGGSVVNSLSGPVSSGFNILYIGSSWGYANPLNGHIARIQYYNTRLSDALVQSLTSIATPAPTFNLDFSTGVMPGGSNFSRGTNATITNSSGYINYAPNNILIASQDIYFSYWSFISANTIINATTAPDGTNTALNLYATASGSGLYAWQTLVTQENVKYVFSLYAKKDVLDWICFKVSDLVANDGGYFFNLNTGTVGSSVNNGAGYVISSPTITPAANGFYRISFVLYSTSTLNTSPTIMLASADNNVNVLLNDSIYIWGAQFEAVMSPTTPSTYIRTFTTPYYAPRFDYNPITLACKGLLIEEQRTNNILYSQDFTNVWSSFYNVSVTPNNTTSPDGSINASKLSSSSGGGSLLVQNVSVSATNYVYSVYAKADSLNWVFLQVSDNIANAVGYFFNISSGTVGSKSLSGGGYDGSSPTITPVGNGWYRISFILSAFASVPIFTITLAYADNDTTTISTGDSIYIWGAQLEQGTCPTSYIYTASSPVTRNSDSCQYSASAALFSTTQGTMGAEFTTAMSDPFPVAFMNNAGTNVPGIEKNTTFGGFYGEIYGVTSVINNGPTFPNTTPVKANWGYQSGNNAFAVNNTIQTGTGAFGALTGVNIQIGQSAPGGSSLNGHIRRFYYYNVKLNNSQIQALTA